MPPQGRGNFAFVWLIAEHFCESMGGVTEFGQTSFSLGEAPGECGAILRVILHCDHVTYCGKCK